MRSEPRCPRCGREVRPPNVWSSDWTCEAHGPVPPLSGVREPNATALRLVLDRTRVPVWLPWPLPPRWLVTGFADVGDDRSGAVSCAVALSGPAPLGGVGELVVVAEDPGVGFAAHLARLSGPDPGTGFDRSPPDHKVRHDGHDIPLWTVDTAAGRAVYVGEALGRWIWFVFESSDAGLLMCEVGGVRDLRDLDDGGVALDPPFGALSPFLAAAMRPTD